MSKSSLLKKSTYKIIGSFTLLLIILNTTSFIMEKERFLDNYRQATNRILNNLISKLEKECIETSCEAINRELSWLMTNEHIKEVYVTTDDTVKYSTDLFHIGSRSIDVKKENNKRNNSFFMSQKYKYFDTNSQTTVSGKVFIVFDYSKHYRKLVNVYISNSLLYLSLTIIIVIVLISNVKKKLLNEVKLIEYKMNGSKENIYRSEIKLNYLEFESLEKSLNLFFEDLRENKENREILEIVIEQSDLAVMITNTDGEIIYANDSLSKLTGYPKEEMIGQTPRLFASGLQDREVYKELWTTLLSGLTWRGELQNKRKSGLLYTEKQINSPVTVNNEIKYFVSIRHDITKRIATQKELEESHKKIKELANKAIVAMESKTEFLSSISHEIRTPLNIITGHVDELKEELEGKQKETTLEIERNLTKLGQHLDNILEFNNNLNVIKSSTVDNINFNYILQDLTDVYKYQAKDKGISFESSLGIKDTNYFGDESRIRKIVSLVLDNAIKFTEKGKVELIISSNYDSETETELIIEVRDTGIGIKAQDQEKIFEQFFQVDATTTREFGGTGIGLTLCKTLLTIVGGDLEVSSEPGRGTTFRIFLKLKKAPIVDTIEISKIETDKKLRVLAVDDNELNILVIQKLFKKLDWHIDSAMNGIEALDAFRENEYDIILMDIEMPKMDGLEATSAIRQMEKAQEKKETPIIIITGHTQETYKIKAKELGANDFFSKPIIKAKLRDMIEKHIQKNNS
jgi:PAS domain S-box-containing protein